jgi:HK97 gp10 family phage protein
MSATLQGATELIKALQTLGERTQRKVMRQAVNAACNPTLKAARANVHDESGLLKKSLAKKIKTYPDRQTVVGIIGPDTQTAGEYKGKPRVPWRYAHLVHDGHIDEKGNFVPGNPFLRRAYESTEGATVDVMADKLGKGIEKEAAKQS